MVSVQDCEREVPLYLLQVRKGGRKTVRVDQVVHHLRLRSCTGRPADGYKTKPDRYAAFDNVLHILNHECGIVVIGKVYGQDDVVDVFFDRWQLARIRALQQLRLSV